MSNSKAVRAHVIAGGFPVGSSAGHDMDYARLRLLQLLHEQSRVTTSVTGDFTDIEKWLPGCQLLVTYVAGPFPNEAQDKFLRTWIEAGGRWLGLHGTSGGKAVSVDGDRKVRRMVKSNHHGTLGGFFLNHPPLRRFEVQVVNREHVLTKDLPASFAVMDELYLIELQDPEQTEILLTTELQKDPSPKGFGFVFEEDTALQPDGKTRVLGFTRELGKGGVAYVSLGHCHSETSNVQPFVDQSVDEAGITPRVFRGSWDTKPFEKLLRNGIEWGCGQAQ